MNSLDGIRILDLSHVLASPWCTQPLVDLEAEVIGIEAEHRERHAHPGYRYSEPRLARSTVLNYLNTRLSDLKHKEVI